MILQQLKRLIQGHTVTGQVATRPRIELPHRYSAIYAVGDVHGCLDLLKAIELQIFEDGEAFPGPKLIVLLGDLIDRGPHSAQTIDHMLTSAPHGWERMAIVGNHEATFVDALHNPKLFERWLGFGGLETLGSYGIGQREIQRTLGNQRRIEELVSASIPSEHLDYISNLPIMITTGSIVFSHSGGRPGTSLEATSDHDLLWYKGPRDDVRTDGRLVVHGHEIVERADIHPNRINIDTGAYDTGILTATRLHPPPAPKIFTPSRTPLN